MRCMRWAKTSVSSLWYSPSQGQANIGFVEAIGSAPCVGFVGASLGAGIGRLQGLYGTMSDSLRSARIMLPNTTVVEASTDSDADLFWAMRGAGFNLGVVLNATFQIYDAPESQGHNFNADFEFPVNIARSFYQALKDKASSMPAPLCIATNLAWSEIYNRVPIFNPLLY